jgi:hypothetical protein
VLVFVLPEFQHMAEKGAVRKDFSGTRVLGLAGMFVLYVLLAGGLAVAVGGAREPRNAIFYGMGWEAVAKGITSAAAGAAARATG